MRALIFAAKYSHVWLFKIFLQLINTWILFFFILIKAAQMVNWVFRYVCRASNIQRIQCFRQKLFINGANKMLCETVSDTGTFKLCTVLQFFRPQMGYKWKEKQWLSCASGTFCRHGFGPLVPLWEIFDWHVQHHHQNLVNETFGRILFIPPIQIQTTEKFMPRHTVLVAYGGQAPY